MLIDGAWSGQAAFVVAGGPSLKALDWSLLKNVPNVIVINRAFRDVPTASAFFTEDIQFIQKFGQELHETFQGEKFYHSLDKIYTPMAVKACPSLRVIELTKPFGQKFWAKSLSEGLSYSSNSAIGALNLVDLFGADPIYLLGFDCKPDKNWIVNYHDSYPIEWRVNGQQLESYASDFKYWAAYHLSHRKVINCNKDSGVDAWPRVDVSYNEYLTNLKLQSILSTPSP